MTGEPRSGHAETKLVNRADVRLQDALIGIFCSGLPFGSIMAGEQLVILFVRAKR